MSLCLNLPINSVSFGQISTLLLRETFKDKKNPVIFPIGNQVDTSTQSDLDKDFISWLTESINKSYTTHKRSDPIFKVWHLNGSLESLSEKQILFSFYELDTPTKVELNIINNNTKVLFSSEYTCETFKANGCKNIKYIPLAFDKYNFSVKNKKYFHDDRIVFNVVGKLEKRKNHKKIIKTWVKKFGNNKKFHLQCSIFNPFMKPEDQSVLVQSEILENKSYFNVSFLNYMSHNQNYNDYLNSAHIVLGLSGGEGWGLPEFHSVALGKYGVIMNAHGYKSWANDSNSILVEPFGKQEAVDNLFFHRNTPFNQGNIFDFNEDEFIAACEKAISKVESNPTNTNGLKLQEQFSSEKFYNNILSELI